MEKCKGNITFGLADEIDYPEVGGIVAEAPMKGPVAVSFVKEAGFFRSIKFGKGLCQILVAREGDSSNIIGCGTRSIMKMYVNGRSEDVGYIGNLRIKEDHRGAGLLSRGYSFLKKLHSDGETRLYLTTIVSGNKYAESLLTSGRCGLPSYRDLGLYRTYVMNASRQARSKDGIMQFDTGDKFKASEIIIFLNKTGSGRQFYPCYSEEDFSGNAQNGITWKDLIVAHQKGEIKGITGVWDQRDVRRIRISGYSGILKYIRLPYNGMAAITGFPFLPEPGENISYVSLGFIAIERNDPNIFKEIVGYAGSLAGNRGYKYIMAGFHEKDPLLRAFAGAKAFVFKSRIYAVFWQDGKGFYDKLDGRTPYLELGIL
ncbi:MAG: hypothetical protein WC512_00740 [Candidatus Omnitrophota bacterium]